MSEVKHKRRKTGLQDIYGKELCVGDIYEWILSYRDREHYLFVVERVVRGHVESSGWPTSPEFPQNSEWSKQVLDQNERSYNIIKVGNIYDNPELIAKRKQFGDTRSTFQTLPYRKTRPSFQIPL